jgi:hypothetical protein
VEDTAALGLMLYDIVYASGRRGGQNEAVFFNARIDRGVIDTDPERVIEDAGLRRRLLTC